MSARADGVSPILQALYEGRSADAEALLAGASAAGRLRGGRRSAVPSACGSCSRTIPLSSTRGPRRLPGPSPGRLLRPRRRRRGAARTRRRSLVGLPPRVRQGDAAAQRSRIGRSRERAHCRSPPRSRRAGERRRGGWAYAAALGRVERKRRDRRARSSRTAPIRTRQTTTGRRRSISPASKVMRTCYKSAHHAAPPPSLHARPCRLRRRLRRRQESAGDRHLRRAVQRLVHGRRHQERLVRRTRRKTPRRSIPRSTARPSARRPATTRTAGR